jgi:transposase
MEVIAKRCCGLDVHKRSVTACVITPKGKEVRQFGTLTSELLKLADWLNECGVTHVAMESAGVYWKPVYNLLEELDLNLLLVNARHMKAVPGRKTDVKDAEWIADLLRHGLLKASFVPPREQRELRELVRHRRGLIGQRAGVAQRLQKVLEGANVKLANAVSDITGKTGLAILRAMVEGEDDPKALSALARGSLQAHRDRLEPALESRMGKHQRFMLTSLLRQLDFLDAEIETVDQKVAEQLADKDELIERLDAIPGVGRRVAEEVLVEIGTDMSRFMSAKHLASWTRICPGNHESGGQHHHASIGPGNRWLRSALVEAARAAAMTKKSYLSAQYRRIRARRGGKRAAIAVAHSILTIIYHLIRDGTTYEDLGTNYFEQRARDRVLHQSVKRIERLGYQVSVVSP